MPWTVQLHDDFEAEYGSYSKAVQDELLAKALLLEEFGPDLGRPHVDTLRDSKHANMKELRFNADNGVWRVAFAFDTKRKAILLTAGDKKGVNEKRSYNNLIKVADDRFDQHVAEISKNVNKDGKHDSKTTKRSAQRSSRKHKGKG